jgi:hypothetical protein
MTDAIICPMFEIQKKAKNMAKKSKRPRPRLTLKVGEEAASMKVLTLLSKRGVDTSTILVSDQPTPELVVGNSHFWGFGEIRNFIVSTYPQK